MKFFDRDWNCVFPWLTVWEKLSIPARRRAFELMQQFLSYL